MSINKRINNVLHVGWWTKEYRMGGSILHVETLMELLDKTGIKNSYFCGGRYNLLFPRPYIKKWRKEYVIIYELVNSPNLIWSFGNPSVHIKDREIERLFLKVIKIVKPDIVHFHELESLTGSLLTLTRELKIPYIIDIHNYWYLCHQRDLLDMRGEVCDNWNEGIKCASCKVLPTSTRLGWMYVGYLKNTPIGNVLDKFVGLRYKKRIKRESIKKVSSDTKNIPIYKKRREFFISELNKADAIIFPSKKSLEVYFANGVINTNSFVMIPINKNYLLIKPKDTNFEPKYPITFGYIGSVLPQKGIHILIEAFKLLPQQIRDKCNLIIYGTGENAYIEDLKKNAVKLRVSFKGRYEPIDINSILERIDVAVVPSLWEDCSPIVLNELRLSRTPIIGSRIGGIQEVINHGVNGYLVSPGDTAELAFYIKKCVENPNIIKTFMKSIKFSFDEDEYIKEIRSIYNEIYHKK